MNRIIPTIGLLVVGFALTASSASAQHYGYGHYGYGHESHQHHAHYDHGPHHGGHGYHNDYHGGYHATDYLTYPNHPPAYVYAAPVHDEPAYVDSLAGDYYCPDSGYCPQAANGFGQHYAPMPSQNQQDDYAYGRSPGLNELSHDGHDHSGVAHDSHDHGDHSHGHEGHSHGPASQSLQNRGNTFASPDRQPMTVPTLPNRNLVPQPPRFNPPSNRQTPPSDAPTNDDPIRMDGPPPSLTSIVSSSVDVG
ncbi:hypothetical protein [Novipirellula rosea]|uniref:hypothetical protein n=1 Tax=Novipirellula rosea TaxID=1031540 RepID=UPI0031E6AEEA